MDNYTEQILYSKPPKSNKVKLGIIMFLMFIGSFTFIAINIFWGMVILIITAMLFVKTLKNQLCEYEYLFVNGDCDIARITNRTKRKEMYSFAAANVVRVLPYNLPKAKNELEVNTKLSIKDFTSGKKDRSDRWYIFFVKQFKVEDAIIMELDDNNIEHINSYYKKKLEK